MRRLGPSVRRAALLALLLPCELPLAASASDGPKPVTSYGDGSGELARLGKDIVHAAKEPNSAEYAALLASLTQTVPESWYGDVFGENSADLYGQYRPALPRLDEQLREFFAGVLRDGATDTTASKHVASCDDGSGELVYPVLALREKQVPLYELRFGKGKKLHRLWALAYMGGAFRFVGELKPVNVFPPGRRDSGAGLSSQGDRDSPHVNRISVGSTEIAAHLVHRVQPEYPEIARLEYLQGKVKLHALIATDGSVKYLQVLAGYCSLAEAAQRAVRQWQYGPTLLKNEPVEVDTTIQVVFKLRRQWERHSSSPDY